MGLANTQEGLTDLSKIQITPTGACPCGTGLSYALCCQPFHLGESNAPTAEKLMRSRYSAFALHKRDYLLKSWHPSTRPSDLSFDNKITWTRLFINKTVQGQLFDTTGVVEFTALFVMTDPTTGSVSKHQQQERSTFSKVEGQWLYVDGEL